MRGHAFVAMHAYLAQKFSQEASDKESLTTRRLKGPKLQHFSLSCARPLGKIISSKKILPSTNQQGSGCSVHEKPTAGRCDHLPAHGTLPQLLTTMALAAHHVATRHQHHGRAMLMADGTGRTGATAVCGTLLRAGGSCIFSGPLTGKKGTVAGIRP